jgi:hypothetical protein
VDYIASLRVESKLCGVLGDVNEVLAHRAQWEKDHPGSTPLNNNALLLKQQQARKSLIHFVQTGTLKAEYLPLVFDENGILPIGPDGWLVKKPD